MIVTKIPPMERPDPYRDIRESMASTLVTMADGVQRLRDVMIGRLSGAPKAAMLVEFSPLQEAANYAKTAADTLTQFGGGDDPCEMFNAMEHACTSITNLTMLLRVVENV